MFSRVAVKFVAVSSPRIDFPFLNYVIQRKLIMQIQGTLKVT